MTVKKKAVLSMMICLMIGSVSAGCGSSKAEGSTTTDSVQDPAPAEAPAAASTEASTTEDEKDVQTEATEEAKEDPAAAPEELPEGETDPFILWEYEGYVDECKGYTWQHEFVNCDYDGDGKLDRVNRKFNESEQTAVYTVEFGNGDSLVVPEGWDTGFPHIQSGDLDGDGTREILVTLSYDTSTDPCSFGDMWLFDRGDAGTYSEVELPLAKTENGGKGFAIEYDKPVDNTVHFRIPEIGLSMTEKFDADFLSSWWTDAATTETRVVYYADIADAEAPVLHCHFRPFPRTALDIGFNLNYVDGKYVAGDATLEEFVGGAGLDDAQGIPVNAEVRGTYADDAVWMAFTTGKSAGTYTISVKNLTRGSNTLTAFLCDDHGNQVAPSSTDMLISPGAIAEAPSDGTPCTSTFDDLDPERTYYINLLSYESVDYAVAVSG